MIRLDLATAEYIGARAQQQDQAAAMPLAPGSAVLVLADGLGGHESGAEASRIVVETFREAAASGRFGNPDTRRQALREALDRANARIAEGVDPAHGHRGMASTVVAAVVAQGEVNWVSVGDSHLYIWRGGRLHKLNEDHSQAGLMVRSGQYHANDPEVLAVKSVLVSALTGRKLELVDLPQRGFKIEPGDVLMLASDGLNTLPDAEIQDIVSEIRAHGSVKLSTALLERVRSRRVERQDNTTVAIARVLEPPRPEPAAAPPRRPAPEPVRKAPAAPPPPLIELEEKTERVEPVDLPAELVADPAPVAKAAPVQPAQASVEPASPPQPLPVTPPPTPAVPVPAAASAPPEPAPTAQAAAVATTPAASSAGPAEAPAPATPAPAAAANPPAEARRPASVRGNGARVADPRPVAAPAAADIVAEPEPATGPLPQARAHVSPAASSSYLRSFAAVVLLLVVAGGAALAAIAALSPGWLAGLPGFGSREQKPTPTPEKPSLAPGSSQGGKAEPVTVPVVPPAPVPAIRGGAPGRPAPAEPAEISRDAPQRSAPTPETPRLEEPVQRVAPADAPAAERPPAAAQPQATTVTPAAPQAAPDASPPPAAAPDPPAAPPPQAAPPGRRAAPARQETPVPQVPAAQPPADQSAPQPQRSRRPPTQSSTPVPGGGG